MTSGWLAPEEEPNKEVVDWDMYLGPAAWRPFNAKQLDGFNFEKGGGLVGGHAWTDFSGGVPAAYQAVQAVGGAVAAAGALAGGHRARCRASGASSQQQPAGGAQRTEYAENEGCK